MALILVSKSESEQLYKRWGGFLLGSYSKKLYKIKYLIKYIDVLPVLYIRIFLFRLISHSVKRMYLTDWVFDLILIYDPNRFEISLWNSKVVNFSENLYQ